MTEIEKLRQEVKELRERLVLLENRVYPIGAPIKPMFTGQQARDPYSAPFVINCGK